VQHKQQLGVSGEARTWKAIVRLDTPCQPSGIHGTHILRGRGVLHAHPTIGIDSQDELVQVLEVLVRVLVLEIGPHVEHDVTRGGRVVHGIFHSRDKCIDDERNVVVLKGGVVLCTSGARKT
jgi:hypothetical protein